MLLAHGVTTIRNPGGPTEQSVALRENVSEGKIVGPQIFTAGQLLNTPDLVEAAIDEAHINGKKAVDTCI
jgi:hypothetical protein